MPVYPVNQSSDQKVATIFPYLNNSGESGGATPVMPISLIASVSASDDNSSATSAAIDTTGATLLVVAAAYLGGSPGIISDSKGNTWTPLTEYASGAGNGRLKMYYAENPTVGTGHTFSIAASGFPSICVGAWNNTAIASVFDDENGAGSASATTQQPGSVTPSLPNSLLVTGVEIVASSGDATIDDDFIVTDTQVDAANFACALAYKVQTTAQAENPTWTSPSAADRMTAAMASFLHS